MLDEVFVVVVESGDSGVVAVDVLFVVVWCGEQDNTDDEENGARTNGAAEATK